MEYPKFRHKNGYILLYMPDHPKAGNSGNKGYIYEHVYVAEKIRGRSLEKGEVVHHLDFDRSNNQPDNLVVLNNEEHVRIHEWISRGLPILGKNRLNKTLQKIQEYGKKKHKDYKITKIARCEICFFPLSIDQIKSGSLVCSRECFLAKNEKDSPINNSNLSKEKLLELLKNNSWQAIGKMFGVSDNAIRKRAVKLGINPKEFTPSKKLLEECDISKKKLVSLLKDNTWESLGKIYGVSGSTIRNWAIKFGIDVQSYSKTNIISASTKENIVKEYKKKKCSLRKLSEIFGVDKDTVKKILSSQVKVP